MRVRLLLSLTVASLVTACGQSSPLYAARSAAQAPAAATPFATSAPPKDPAADASYPGRWAPRAADCAAHPWVFAQRTMEDSSGVTCAFITVEPTSAGYTINADCRRGGALAGGHMMLTITNAREMTVSDGPWSSAISLVRCPPA